jgi:restriction-modification enzyme MmeI-like protein
MQPTGHIWRHTLNVFALSKFSAFSCIQTRAHELWVRHFASTLEDRLRYTPSDCYENFPFPTSTLSDEELEATGHEYHELRSSVMIKSNLGLTKTYNRFHDSAEQSADISRLRELHA